MKRSVLFAAVALLAACGTTAEEQQAITAVEQYVQRLVGGSVTPVHSEAHVGRQADAQGRKRRGYTVEYTFKMERAGGQQEEVTAVYFADSAGNVMPSTL